MKKNLLFTLLLCFLSQFAFSQTGTLEGKLIDGDFNDVLPFANIIVKDSQTGSTSDFEGRYSLNLQPGTYNIVFSFIGYQTKEITDVVIKSNETTVIDVTLTASSAALDEVIITTSARRNTESSVLSFQKNSVSLMDGLSLETMKETGSSNLASAVKNIPGVSVQNGKFVYVRGLGDRYTKTILNGVDIPGLDPDRNTLQMDIFPTSVLENVIVIKSSTADQPADFTGGVVDIVTKDIPSREEYSVSLGLGYNHDFHFNKNYLEQKKSGTDFLGFDDGLRDNPIPLAQEIPLPQENGEAVEILTRRFSSDLAAQRTRSFVDLNFSTTAGGNFNVGESNKLGYFASLSYRNETEYYDEFIDGQVFRKDDSDSSEYELITDRTQEGELGNNNVLISGLAGITFKTDRSKYRLNGLHIQNGESEASIFYQSNRIVNSNDLVKDNLIYTQRSISNALLSGSHSLGSEANWKVDWKLSPTYARIEDKDFRTTPFKINVDSETGEETYTIEPSESGLPSRIFRDLEEINLAGKISIENSHKLFTRNAKLKFGGAYSHKYRDFGVDKFAFPFLNLPSDFAGGDPNQVLADVNIYDPSTGKGVFLRRDSGISDTYESTITVGAAYVSEEFKVNDWFYAIVGVRFEKFDLIYTGQRQDGTSFNEENIIDKADLFPSVNLIFDLDEDASKKIRTSYSKTTARPSFKEASLAEIFDPINNTFFIGNIDVQPSYIDNFDVRFERYGEGGDFFALSGFYKSFKDPIELSFIRSATGQFTPLNLGDAQVLGGEIELRKNLGFISGWQNFFMNVNFSLIESRQKFSEDELESRQDNLRDGETLKDYRKLQGQSPYLINVGINYEDDYGWDAGLYYNVQGKTLQIVGGEDIPDVFTLPYHNMKIVVSKTLGKEQNSTLSLKFDNILNYTIKSVYQSFGAVDKIYSKWNPGQTISLNFSVKL
jgi:hypothetical protein